MPESAEYQAEYRLKHLRDQLTQGAAAWVRLELAQWVREPDCPAPARVLYAALLAETGAEQAAMAALRPLLRQFSVPADAVRLAVALLLDTGLAEPARQLAQRAQHHADADLLDWLGLMALPGLNPAPANAAELEALTLLLRQTPEVVPSLVCALQHQPEARRVDLLRRAAARLIDEHADADSQLALHSALAELALLAGDTDNARRWAHRGLRLDTLNARLALILAELEDDAKLGPPARQVLARVHEAHPTYPDVTAALIRREQRDGERRSAQRHLAEWLAREPESPAAHQLARRLAA